MGITERVLELRTHKAKKIKEFNRLYNWYGNLLEGDGHNPWLGICVIQNCNIAW